MAAAGLHRLAEAELNADRTAHSKAMNARLLGIAATVLTLLALALAAAAGVGTLAEVTGRTTAGWIALSSAAASAVSAWVQSKTSGDAMRTDALAWRHHADDVLDSLVRIVANLPMQASEVRRVSEHALSAARYGEPTRQSRGAPQAASAD